MERICRAKKNINTQVYKLIVWDAPRATGFDVLIEDERERDGEVEHREALGADLVRENLDGVRHDEGGGVEREIVGRRSRGR